MPTQLTRVAGLEISRQDSVSLLCCAIGLLSAVGLCVVLPTVSTAAGAMLMGGLAALIWVVISFLRTKFHYVVLAWLMVYPYCYYFFSFPRKRSVFTVDRAFIILVVVEIVLFRRHVRGTPLTRDVRVAAYLWVAYCFACLLSVSDHPVLDILGSYRLIFDGVIMPALLGFYAIRSFPILDNLNKVHACVCILMVTIAAVTAFELFTGTNLLPAVGAVDAWVHSEGFKIIRVDGPFETSGVLCLVGTMGFFLIVYFGRLIGTFLARKEIVLHKAGICAALFCAFAPMNRGLVIGLSVCAGLDYISRNPFVSRGTWNRIAVLLAFLVIFSKTFYPRIFEDRVSSTANVYQRIAQDRQTLQVIGDHPLLGVGFNLYHETIEGDPHYSGRWKGLESMDTPHNSGFAVFAEEGGLGFLLYVSAQIFFIRAMWTLRGVNRLGCRVFLYCVIVYTVYGLDAGMAYFSDLNLFYMFVLGLILQIQLRLSAAEALATDPSHG